MLDYLAEGLTNKEIAVRMNYSAGTVKNAVQRILLNKLGVADRIQAAILGRPRGGEENGFA